MNFLTAVLMADFAPSWLFWMNFLTAVLVADFAPPLAVLAPSGRHKKCKKSVRWGSRSDPAPSYTFLTLFGSLWVTFLPAWGTFLAVLAPPGAFFPYLNFLTAVLVADFALILPSWCSR